MYIMILYPRNTILLSHRILVLYNRTKTHKLLNSRIKSPKWTCLFKSISVFFISIANRFSMEKMYLIISF